MAWPTTSNPRTEFISLRLTVDEAESLDEVASDMGASRSAAVRIAVENLLASHKRKKSRD